MPENRHTAAVQPRGEKTNATALPGRPPAFLGAVGGRNLAVDPAGEEDPRLAWHRKLSGKAVLGPGRR